MASRENEAALRETTQDVLDRLAQNAASDAHLSLPRASLAGVLVLLCRNKQQGLSVILTTRALTMRSYPGETALPGGRMEHSDEDISATAIREAEEEIRLSIKTAGVRVITTLPPFLSKNLLFVVPVVAFADKQDVDLLKTLQANEAEVGAIWSWPFRDFLGLPTGDEEYLVTYAFRDVKWLQGSDFRLREFRNDRMASSVTGLTADILMEAALIAYGVAEPGFARAAVGQLTNKEMIQAVLEGRAGKDGDTRSSIRKPKVKEDEVGTGNV